MVRQAGPPSGTRSVYRIATSSRYDELDLTGAGAEATGGRWNHKGTPLVYASSSIALAVLETVVHLAAAAFPRDRYIVEIRLPVEQFDARRVVDPPPDAWDAIPESFKSKDFGSAWARAQEQLVLDVPSVIVPLERNLLLNPRHPAIAGVTARNLGRFDYDDRLRPR